MSDENSSKSSNSGWSEEAKREAIASLLAVYEYRAYKKAAEKARSSQSTPDSAPGRKKRGLPGPSKSAHQEDQQEPQEKLRQRSHNVDGNDIGSSAVTRDKSFTLQDIPKNSPWVEYAGQVIPPSLKRIRWLQKDDQGLAALFRGATMSSSPRSAEVEHFEYGGPSGTVAGKGHSVASTTSSDLDSLSSPRPEWRGHPAVLQRKLEARQEEMDTRNERWAENPLRPPPGVSEREWAKRCLEADMRQEKGDALRRLQEEALTKKATSEKTYAWLKGVQRKEAESELVTLQGQKTELEKEQARTERELALVAEQIAEMSDQGDDDDSDAETVTGAPIPDWDMYDKLEASFSEITEREQRRRRGSTATLPSSSKSQTTSRQSSPHKIQPSWGKRQVGSSTMFETPGQSYEGKGKGRATGAELRVMVEADARSLKKGKNLAPKEVEARRRSMGNLTLKEAKGEDVEVEDDL